MSFDKKQYISKKLQIFIFFNILALLILIFSSLYGYKNYITNYNNIAVLNYQIKEQTGILNDLNFDLDLANQSKKFSQGLTANKLSNTGIQYNLGRQVLAELSKKYNIYPSSTFYASNQIQIPNLSFNSDNNINYLMESNVAVTLNTSTDTNAMQFLDGVINFMPGFWKIEYVRITKIADINESFITDIKNGIDRSGVKTEIGLEWYDFRKKN